MKRVGLITKGCLIMFVSFLFFLGCGKKEDNSNGIIKIVVWRTADEKREEDVFNKIIENFNQKNKGKIEAKVQFIPRGNGYDYENKLNTAISSGNAPDVVAIDGPTIASYANLGIISSLDDYLTKEEKENYLDSVIKQGTYEKKIYALSPSESSVVLYYNKDIFKANNIKEPSPDLNKAWTWEEVYQIAKKVNKNGVKGINLTWDLGEGQIYGFAPIIWSNGGDLLNSEGTKSDGFLNSKKNIEALTYIQKFIVENLATVQAEPNDFANGKSAMYLMGTWEMSNLKNNFKNLNWGVTYYPASTITKKVVSPSGDWSYGITSAGKNKKEAALVVKEITSKEAVIEFSKVTSKPASRKDSFAELKMFDEYPYNIIKEQTLKTAHPRNSSIYYPVLSAEFSKAMQDIMKGFDVKQSLDSASEKFDKEVKKNK